MTKAEWIARLRKAKVRALKEYPIVSCIWLGCAEAGIKLGITATFDVDGEYRDHSSRWVNSTKPTRSQVAAVFDESIKLAGGEP